MTVLSSRKILRRIRNGELYVSPILDTEQIGPVSIDLRLGHVALFVRAAGASHVDPRDYAEKNTDEQKRETDRRQKFARSEFVFGERLLLHPGTLTLVPTLEWVNLPTDLKGVVTARSSWAREGLNIATANFINPGYNGVITLELANLGHIPIALYPGLRIAQIAFYQVSESAAAQQTSQFSMSFEPRAGEIGKHDEAFLDIRAEFGGANNSVNAKEKKTKEERATSKRAPESRPPKTGKLRQQ
jgi:dCTP deaminase